MSLEDEIARTQSVLQPLIERPVLKEKLLTKPPFRFLHDVITAVTAATGFGRGLYAGPELDSGEIKDKDAKLNYLSKIIGLVSICKGTSLDVRGAKIVAGLEPDKTNQLLQSLAECASDKSIDQEEAVRLALSSAVPGAVPRKGGGGGGGAKEESKGFASHDDGDAKGFADGMGSLDGASAGLDAAIEACDGSVERTKEVLGPLITKPKLSDKLLGKPPFRFLHDLLSEVQRVSGFGEGLYTEAEMDSGRVTDKQAKVDYLAKMIKLVGFHLNTIVEARPAKIVSGLEPENTNRFLQLVGVAAKMAPQSHRAVQAVHAEYGTAPPPSANDAAAAKDEEPPPRQKNKAPAAVAREDATAPRHNNNNNNREATSEEQFKSSEAPAEAKGFAVMGAGGSKEEEDVDGVAASATTGGSSQKRSTRPVTARRRPPKAKPQGAEDKASAAQPKNNNNTKAKIMTDGEDDGMDDDDDGDDAAESALAAPKASAEGKSKLVREIQEEERAAKAKAAQQQQQLGENGAEAKGGSGGGIRFGRIDAAAKVSAGGLHGVPEMDLVDLQASIQQLCQATNPLGKCMDYVHEDLDTMNKELDKWAADSRDHTETLDHEKQLSHDLLGPLHAQLAELDDRILDEHKSIRAVKARVLKHEQRIQDLLRMVCTSR